MPKRKQPTDDRDDSASEPYSDELDVSSPEVLDFDEAGEVVFNSNRDAGSESGSTSGGEEDDEEKEDSGVENVEEEEGEWESESENELEQDAESEMETQADNAKRPISLVSFASLSQAQESLPSKKRKRNQPDNSANEDKLTAIRARLAELREKNGLPAINLSSQPQQSSSHQPDEKEEEGSDEEESGPPRKMSKHAPTSKSSKFTVSRKRTVIELPRNTARDPRFDASGEVDPEKIARNYKFLDSYVEDEIKEIQTTLKTAKLKAKGKLKGKKTGPKLSEAELEALKKELVVKESRRAEKVRGDREREVRSEHKRKEKEMVKNGKTPYFLKESEVRRQVLVKRFEGLSEGKRGRVVEKKRRKMVAKERRNMPDERRG